ncbi:hypothetical protein COD21_24555 [Bacillus cereus]|uniref:hypothetical protein n=1 Tax=Bacillus cereus TaxID=1396 RepID=UPI000BFB60BC|nr:hypothetical protein [Bacillus cereus]PGU06700.1 hypothetical protein COD21_24555 [Bacillus cereus]
MTKERMKVKMKQCSYCRKMKSTADGFHKESKSSDGLQTRCKMCNGKTRTTGKYTLTEIIKTDGKETEVKQCKSCAEKFPLDSYYRNGRGGLKPICKRCYEAKYDRARAVKQALDKSHTNKMQRQGIASFSVTGVGSFIFKENNVSSAIEQPLSELISDSVLQLIEVENKNLQLTGPVIG